MVYTLRFFSSKCSLFHNSNIFGSCIIHILDIGCAKIKKKIMHQRVNAVHMHANRVRYNKSLLFFYAPTREMGGVPVNGASFVAYSAQISTVFAVLLIV